MRIKRVTKTVTFMSIHRLHDNLKCDECGKFISYQDLLEGLAYHSIIMPNSAQSHETYETLCREHRVQL